MFNTTLDNNYNNFFNMLIKNTILSIYLSISNITLLLEILVFVPIIFIPIFNV